MNLPCRLPGKSLFPEAMPSIPYRKQLLYSCHLPAFLICSQISLLLKKSTAANLICWHLRTDSSHCFRNSGTCCRPEMGINAITGAMAAVDSLHLQGDLGAAADFYMKYIGNTGITDIFIIEGKFSMPATALIACRQAFFDLLQIQPCSV